MINKVDKCITGVSGGYRFMGVEINSLQNTVWVERVGVLLFL